jgi:hypothetical protein
MGQNIPILFWICQYRFFEAQVDYQGKDDMIALAISAGANVNAVNPSNRTTPLFFSMKYSSVRTVEMLVEAGAKVGHRDIYGQTIWKNAVEHPDIGVIDFLIKRCSEEIPVANEKIIMREQAYGEGNISTLTLSDHMLRLYMGMLATMANPDNCSPLSWRVMGNPDDEVLGEALIRVIQAGAILSGNKRTTTPTEPFHIDPLSLAMHIDSSIVQSTASEEEQRRIRRTGRFLAGVVFGTLLPLRISRSILELERASEPTDSTCPICLTGMDERNQPIDLYCGHRFCTVCIRSYGQASLSVEQEMTEKRCPICRRLLVSFKTQWTAVENLGF